MAGERKQMTVADYAAVSLCPSLIVVMLTALVHFLILCIYRGEFTMRLTYILFMFIVGATGIARISLDFGRAHASVYAGILGLATLMVLAQFSNPVFALAMIVLVWFLADHITADCTVIEDAERASGEGLLGTGKLLGGRRSARHTDVQLDGTTTVAATQSSESGRKKRRRRGATKPGRSVFLLAMAALPLFGLGQWLLPHDPQVAGAARWALATYLFATLSLLVATSFLALRAYLRRRGTEMPAKVSVSWIGGGIVLTVLLLMASFLLPLPGHTLARLELPAAVESPEWLSPSRWGWGEEGVEDPQSRVEASAERGGEGTEGDQGQGKSQSGQQSGGDQSGGQQSGGEQSGGEQSGGEQSGGEQSGGEQSGGEQSGGEQSGGEQSGGEQSGGEQSSGQQSGGEQSSGQQSGGEQSSGQQSGGEQSGGEPSGGEQSGGEQSGGEPSGGDQSGGEPSEGESGAASQQDASQPPASSERSPRRELPDLTRWMPRFSSLLKLLIGLFLVAVIAWFVIRNRAALIAAWQAFLASWKRWQKDLGVAEEDDAAPVAERTYRSFASFRNPTGTSADGRQQIVISFAALEAWAREAGEARRDDETPSEFLRRLGRAHPPQAGHLQRLAAAYNRVVYGRRNVAAEDLQAARSLWQWMTSTHTSNPEPAVAP
ncbi:DUF4129 domain-containing protein [Roseimaritima sediminicola]|uniref:DUF4129 domain-containing protein n=1 Tax=Roseimaritima sediminicola TaxID=2662066 RepID=UPI00129853F3|nr:DUF4129 domain-containing protein [Roseimaritima sediminicola]